LSKPKKEKNKEKSEKSEKPKDEEKKRKRVEEESDDESGEESDDDAEESKPASKSKSKPKDEKKEKGEKGEKKTKRKKDKNAPKGPTSAFLYFSNENRERLKKEGLTFGEIGKQLGIEWKQISPEDKKVQSFFKIFFIYYLFYFSFISPYSQKNKRTCRNTTRWLTKIRRGTTGRWPTMSRQRIVPPNRQRRSRKLAALLPPPLPQNPNLPRPEKRGEWRMRSKTKIN
jgi:hypothetical protein